jgi:hypothetical protein
MNQPKNTEELLAVLRAAFVEIQTGATMMRDWGTSPIPPNHMVKFGAGVATLAGQAIEMIDKQTTSMAAEPPAISAAVPAAADDLAGRGRDKPTPRKDGVK